MIISEDTETEIYNFHKSFLKFSYIVSRQLKNANSPTSSSLVIVDPKYSYLTQLTILLYFTKNPYYIDRIHSVKYEKYGISGGHLGSHSKIAFCE